MAHEAWKLRVMDGHLSLQTELTVQAAEKRRGGVSLARTHILGQLMDASNSSVHVIVQDDVPEGARRKPAAAALSAPASAAVSEATEAAAARSGADGDADPGAVSSAAAPAAAAAMKPSLGEGTAGDADAAAPPALLHEAAAGGVPEEVSLVKEEGVSEEAAVGVKAEPSGTAEAAAVGPGQQEVVAGPSSGAADAQETSQIGGAAGTPEAAGVGKAVVHAAGLEASEGGHSAVNGIGNGAAQPAGEDDADMAEASGAEGGAEDEEEDGEVECHGRKGRSRAGSKREKPDSKEDAAVDEADGKVGEVTRATRGSKRVKTAV